MLITDHWSATSPARIRDYHVEIGQKSTIDPAYNKKLGTYNNISGINFDELKALFNIWKNVDFDTVTSYGTWHLNSDPRNGSSNIEIGSLVMGGESVQVCGPWGAWPYTFAHAWMHAAVNARVCYLKKIDPMGSFQTSALQNGPIYNISTHAERAIQTPDGPAANLRPKFGYFIYSGDSDCRWDIAARDVSLAPKLKVPADAYTEAIASAGWIREQSESIFKTLTSTSDMWGLDKPAD